MTPEACRIARGLPCATPARSVIQLAVGKARTFLQIKRAICGAGQSTINVMVKEINKSKSL
jgi:hypothetical protein